MPLEPVIISLVQPRPLNLESCISYLEAPCAFPMRSGSPVLLIKDPQDEAFLLPSKQCRQSFSHKHNRFLPLSQQNHGT